MGIVTFMHEKKDNKEVECKSFCIRFFDEQTEQDFVRAYTDFRTRGDIMTMEQRDGAYVISAPGPMNMGDWDAWRILWGLAHLHSTTIITEKGIRYYAAVMDFDYIAPCARPLAS